MFRGSNCLCGLAVRVPGCRMEMHCVSCEVWTEFICYVEESRPLLWSRGQSYWLQIQRSAFDSRHYQIFWEVVGLERGPLSLVSTIEELLERKSSGSGLENREYGSRDQSRWPHGTLYPQKLALTSPTSGGRSVGIVRSRTQATKFVCSGEVWDEGYNVVGWSTMLKVGRSWDRFPIRSLIFFNWPNLSSPLTEMSTRNLSEE
jgi:hypothetical protein